MSRSVPRARLTLPILALAILAMTLPGCIVVVGGSSRSSDPDSYAYSGTSKRIGVELAPPGPALAAQLGVEADHASVVNRVLPGSPAAAAGIQLYDVLVGVSGTTSGSPIALRAAVQATHDHESITLKFLRSGQPVEVTVTPEYLGGDWNK